GADLARLVRAFDEAVGGDGEAADGDRPQDAVALEADLAGAPLQRRPHEPARVALRLRTRAAERGEPRAQREAEQEAVRGGHRLGALSARSPRRGVARSPRGARAPSQLLLAAKIPDRPGGRTHPAFIPESAAVSPPTAR